MRIIGQSKLKKLFKQPSIFIKRKTENKYKMAFLLYKKQFQLNNDSKYIA